MQNEVEGVAGVQGGDPNTTTAGDLVDAEIAFLSDRANLTFGGSPTPPATDPDVDTLDLAGLAANQTQGRAAALGVNLSTANSTALVTNTATVTTTGGPLTVLATERRRLHRARRAGARC